MSTQHHSVFVTGGTGYVGRPLIAQLLERGHEVLALVRAGSEKKLPAGCQPILGDALTGKSYAAKIAPADTFVQLVGVSHPSPSKAAEFRSIDLASGRSALEAAKDVGIQHFVYVSVAHPAPVMKAYIEVRSQCEAVITESGMNATILRPWYVLGPGHRWPYLLLPMYKLMELLPSTRDGATRLGLVTLEQMVWALIEAVESPAHGVRIVEVPQIRASLSSLAQSKSLPRVSRGPSTCSHRASAARVCAWDDR
ncbi:MAG: NAD(P)H-binding protein [Terriglobales bacterium]